LKRAVRIAGAACAAFVFAGLAGFAVAELGLYDVAATSPHYPLTYDVIHWVGVRSIARRARYHRAIAPSSEQKARALLAYDRVCATCHGAPGRAPDAFAEGMNPAPPPLQQVGRDWSTNEIFQATAGGVKMTGMPAFAFRMSEAEIWAIASVVRALPDLSVEDYRDRVKTASAVSPDAAPERSADMIAPDAGRGRIALMQHGCATCHAIPGLPGGREAQTGPSLAGIGARKVIAGTLSNSDPNLAFWIRRPDLVRPDSAMPDMRVSERDAADMVAYLRTLVSP
jgi:mono/diheme cytochrome c family protein